MNERYQGAIPDSASPAMIIPDASWHRCCRQVTRTLPRLSMHCLQYPAPVARAAAPAALLEVRAAEELVAGRGAAQEVLRVEAGEEEAPQVFSAHSLHDALPVQWNLRGFRLQQPLPR
mmetsp:Transcript_155660/g.274963  ORF Transcript_155660/g.274963 Transcript_155660/m.274963 type:complete len:118 (-) Transcript_155660:2213-2566(-)